MFDLFKLIGNLPAIKAKAPEMLGDFLDRVLNECSQELNPDNGEKQIIFIAHPINREGDDKNRDYTISVVALSEDDQIIRIIRTITLKDAIQTILKNIENVKPTV